MLKKILLSVSLVLMLILSAIACKQNYAVNLHTDDPGKKTETVEVTFVSLETGESIKQPVTASLSQQLGRSNFVYKGYELKGWSKTAGSTSVEYTDGGWIKTDRDVTLFAVWGEKYYKVFYVSDGVKVKERFYGYFDEVDLHSYIPAETPSGKVFAGWYLGSVRLSEPVYSLTEQSGDDAVVTLNAHWIDISDSITITFHGNGGTFIDRKDVIQSSYSQTAYAADRDFLDKNKFSRTGFVFKGWAEQSGDGTDVAYGDNVQVSFTSDTNLYAVWEPVKYSIHFNPNGASEESPAMPDMVDVAYNSTGKLSKNSYFKDGFRFTGWAKDSSGTKVLEDCADAKELSEKNNDTVNLFACWVPICYSVTFKPNGGEEAEYGYSNISYDDSVTLVNRFSRPDYGFIGWSRDADSETPEFDNNATVSRLTQTDGDNVIFYAIWNRIHVTGINVLNEPSAEKRVAAYGSQPDLSDYEIELLLDDGNSQTVRFNPSDFTCTFDNKNVGSDRTLTVVYRGIQLTAHQLTGYTITPRNLTVNWTVPEFTYNGSVQVPTAQIAAGGVLTGDDCTVVVYGGKTNAGTHNATAELNGTDKDNYVISQGASCVFTISKQTVSVTAPYAALGLVYNGQMQDLVTGGSTDHGEIQYSLTGQTVYGTEVKAKDSGTYSVSWKVLLSNDEKVNFDLPERYSGTNTIDGITVYPKNLTVDWTGPALTYNGTEQAPTAQIASGGVLGNDDCTVTVSGGQTNANKSGESYTATASLSGTDSGNYTISSGSTCDFTIGKQTVIVTAPKAVEGQVYYYNTERFLHERGKADKGQFKYKLEAESDYGTSLKKAVNAGSYVVYWKIELSESESINYELSDTSGTISCKIDPRGVNITWTVPKFTYNGSVQVPTAQIASGVLPGDKDACTVTVSGGQTNAGTYTATASLSSSNYVIIGDDAECVFEIGKASRTDVPTGLTGGRNEITGLDSNEKYEYITDKDLTDKKAWTTVAPESDKITGLGEGTYYVRFQATDNYESSSASDAISVLPALTDYLNGYFTVNAENKKVKFARGNLYVDIIYYPYLSVNSQYSYTWNYEENQYDFRSMDLNGVGGVDSDNVWINNGVRKTISDSQEGGTNAPLYRTQGLFTWSDDKKRAINLDADYTSDHHFIADSSVMGLESYILTADEWTYLVQRHNGTLWGCAVIQTGSTEVPGIVLLPDPESYSTLWGGWSLPDGLTFNSGSGNRTDYRNNVYTKEQWAKMEANGAVFLPYTGYLQTTGNNNRTFVYTADGKDKTLYYVTSTSVDFGTAKGARFMEYNCSGYGNFQISTNNYARDTARAIRTVKVAVH